MYCLREQSHLCHGNFLRLWNPFWCHRTLWTPGSITKRCFPVNKHVIAHKNSIVFLHGFHHKTSVKTNLKTLPCLYPCLMSVHCVENKAGTRRDKYAQPGLARKTPVNCSEGLKHPLFTLAVTAGGSSYNNSSKGGSQMTLILWFWPLTNLSLYLNVAVFSIHVLPVS